MEEKIFCDFVGCTKCNDDLTRMRSIRVSHGHLRIEYYCEDHGLLLDCEKIDEEDLTSLDFVV